MTRLCEAAAATHLGEDHVRGGQGRMAAEVHLHRGREPAQVEASWLVTLAAKSGFAQIVLRCDGEQHRVCREGGWVDAGRPQAQEPTAATCQASIVMNHAIRFMRQQIAS